MSPSENETPQKYLKLDIQDQKDENKTLKH